MTTSTRPPGGKAPLVMVTNIEEGREPWQPLTGTRVVGGLAIEAVRSEGRQVAGAGGVARLYLPDRGATVLGDRARPVMVEYLAVLPTEAGQHLQVARTLYAELSRLHAYRSTIAADELGQALDILAASTTSAGLPADDGVVAFQPSIGRDLIARWRARPADLPPATGDIIDLTGHDGVPPRSMWARLDLCSFGRWDDALFGIDGLLAASLTGDPDTEGQLARLVVRNSVAAALVAARRIDALRWDCIDLDRLVERLLDTSHRTPATTWPIPGLLGMTWRDNGSILPPPEVEAHGPFVGFEHLPMPAWYLGALRDQPLVAITTTGPGPTPTPSPRYLTAVSVQTTPAAKPIPAMLAGWSITRMPLPADGDPVPLEPALIEYLCVHPHSPRQHRDLAWALAAQLTDTLAEVLAGGGVLAGHHLQWICDVVAANAMRDPTTLTRHQRRAWRNPATTDGQDLLADLRRLATSRSNLVLDLRHGISSGRRRRQHRPRPRIDQVAARHAVHSSSPRGVDLAELVEHASSGDPAAQRRLHRHNLARGLATALAAAHQLGTLDGDTIDLDTLAEGLDGRSRVSLHRDNNPLTPVLSRPRLRPPAEHPTEGEPR